MRVVRQLALDEGQNYPEAARVAPLYSYMDDFIHSVPSPDEALQLYDQLVKMFASGGFNLTKFISNSPQFLQNIPVESRASKNLNFDSESETKLVGLRWDPVTDCFTFKVDVSENGKCTKRFILSKTAALYDPLGLLAPLTAYMKLLVQECWKRDLSWDDDTPSDIQKIWTQIQNELSNLSQIKIPRHVGVFPCSEITLVGFADASEKCYGAVIYLRIGSLTSPASSVSLLCARSRLAPLKKITLARLELCAAHLLAQLVQAVLKVFNARCKVNNIIAFSDSTITLAWIHSSPHRWQTFIANRTSAIQEIIAPQFWHHIPGHENPSDLISRPVTPNKLIDNHTWFQGPQWLSLSHDQWPVSSFDKDNIPTVMPESKSVSLLQTINPELNTPLVSLTERLSKWTKLINTIVYVLRFAKILKNKGCITVSELELAETHLIKAVQNKHFASDINDIKTNKPLRTPMRKLNAFIDNEVCSDEFNKAVIRELTPQKIEFKINPPYAPHMGGLWEGNIKQVKTHLSKAIGSQILTYEELNTVLVQIEALMNSRPLCVLSSDPSEPLALTPSHFLNLTPLKYIPAVNLDDISINRLQRYKLIDKMVQSYWQRWHIEYLTSLQSREKWNTISNPVKKGQVVIVREEKLPLLCWPLAVVEETYPGNDGITRVVKVKTKTGKNQYEIAGTTSMSRK
ncbi:uncharacterized protein [Choristoneura fumiferana]|uniref:uncharacterized protein n=1 Tax=Choristoneura fumiferana TaxID=7141 RepID=UPI003D154956